MTSPPVALEDRDAEGERLHSPSAARNRDPIRAVFVRLMPRQGRLLEVGSGSGEHVSHFAAALPAARFAPSDPDAASRRSIAAWTEHLALVNVEPPLSLDAAAPRWETAVGGAVDGVFSINMIHIAPFAAAAGLFRGASALLEEGAPLFLYGPFSRRGAHAAESNAAFDASLKARNPDWGVRDLDNDIVPLARRCGFSLAETVDMPANNLSALFVRGR